MGGMRRGNWSPERVSECEAKEYRASKAPGGAGSLLSDGWLCCPKEQNHGLSEPEGILRLCLD